MHTSLKNAKQDQDNDLSALLVLPYWPTPAQQAASNWTLICMHFRFINQLIQELLGAVRCNCGLFGYYVHRDPSSMQLGTQSLALSERNLCIHATNHAG
jgi:hypothetical protein